MFRRDAALALAMLVVLTAPEAWADDTALLDAPEIELSPSEGGSGWYLRGDVGYAGHMRGGDPDYTIYAPGGTIASRETFDTTRFSEPFSYGFGVGYQFNSMFRADLTTDFFNGRLTGTSDTAAPCSGVEPAGTSCGFSHHGAYSAATVMASGYVDLATFMGVTPYVGAGLGATSLRWNDFTSTASCRDGVGTCSGTTYAAETFPGQNSWRFTYALSVGASYDLTDTMKLDFGYRFSDTSGGKAVGYGAAETSFGATGIKGHDEGFQKHEFRVGLRVNLW